MAEATTLIGVREGRLRVEECDAAELARRFGTPLHVVSETALRRRAAQMRDAFQACWPDGPVLLVPSFKANLTLALRRVLNEEGTGCDVFGAAELEAALGCGVPPGADLAERRRQGRGPDRARGCGRRADHAGQRGGARAGPARWPNGSAATCTCGCGCARTSSHVTTPSDLFAGEVSVAESVAAYKPGIPLDDLLALGARPCPRRAWPCAA